MTTLDLIEARSLAGTGTHTRTDNLALVKAIRSVETVLADADKQPGPFKGITSTALVHAAIREALNG